MQIRENAVAYGRGLGRYEGAPVEAIRFATRRALDNLVMLCVEEGADEGAAWSALFLAMDAFLRGDLAVASGWSSTAGWS